MTPSVEVVVVVVQGVGSVLDFSACEVVDCSAGVWVVLACRQVSACRPVLSKCFRGS
jgi:hypothetical protein